MSDGPISVNDKAHGSVLRRLAEHRERLRQTIGDIGRVMADFDKIDADVSRDTTIAAVWAATLMVADICKIGLSAGDRRANVLFAAQDRALERANKVLKLLGLRTVTTRTELMKALDPGLQGTAKLTGEIREARALLKQHGAKETKEIKLLLDLGTAMTEDTLLILQAGASQQAAFARTSAARAQSRDHLMRLQRSLRAVDEALTQAFDRAALLRSIARNTMHSRGSAASS